MVDDGEQCDDGNTTSRRRLLRDLHDRGAGICGDGTVNDAARSATTATPSRGDGCSATCTTERGRSAATASTRAPSSATTATPRTATAARRRARRGRRVCGDGISVDAGEECDDGNTVAGDGCEADCTKTTATRGRVPDARSADRRAAPARSPPGDAAEAAHRHRAHARRRSTAAARSSSTTTGHDHLRRLRLRARRPPARPTITCPDGVISPGLINPHDHITFTQNSPVHRHRRALRAPPRVAQAARRPHEDLRRPAAPPTTRSAGASCASSWAARRRSSAPAARPACSATSTAADEEGLDQTRRQLRHLPARRLRRHAARRRAAATPTVDHRDRRSPRDDAYLPHIAEGIDADAENEFLCLSSATPTAAQDLVSPQTAIIHAHRPHAADYADDGADGHRAHLVAALEHHALRQHRAASPRPRASASRSRSAPTGSPTGSMNMLRELAVRRRAQHELLRQLLHRRAALADGHRQRRRRHRDRRRDRHRSPPGKVADIAIFDGKTHKRSPRGDRRRAEGRRARPARRQGRSTATTPSSPPCPPRRLRHGRRLRRRRSRSASRREIGKSLRRAQDRGRRASTRRSSAATPTNEPTLHAEARPTSVSGSTIYTGAATADDTRRRRHPQRDRQLPDASSTRSARWTTASRPTSTATASATRATSARSTPTRRPARRSTPTTATATASRTPPTTAPTIANPTRRTPTATARATPATRARWRRTPAPRPARSPSTPSRTAPSPSARASSLDQRARHRRAAPNGFFVQVEDRRPRLHRAPTTRASSSYDPAQHGQGRRSRDAHRRPRSPTSTGRSSSPAPTTMVVDVGRRGAAGAGRRHHAEVATGGTKAAELESVLVQVDDVDGDRHRARRPARATRRRPTSSSSTTERRVRVNDFLYLVAPFPALGQTFASITGVLELPQRQLEARAAQRAATSSPARRSSRASARR